ncbi:hypothetical protein ACFPES_31660 [Paenibacillus sp. GCM10023248]|uniref:hypothetical protein n=1 Tax=Bacillales TaxID=1385 RepID=UPI002378F93C|nr:MULTISPECIES: hypothetical protein [Bacillales]MDD9271600.1 hypothetical protein [Paenibacillus sp. MAHUQ-63]MDR6884044.1 hypothetical protein [Bacillus sp. 3255]
MAKKFLVAAIILIRRVTAASLLLGRCGKALCLRHSRHRRNWCIALPREANGH